MGNNYPGENLGLMGGSTPYQQEQAVGMKAPRRGEVGNSLEALVRELDILEKAVDVLGEKLAPIMSPAPPSTAEKRQERSATCDMAMGICNQANRLQTLRERVEFLLSRLEL